MGMPKYPLQIKGQIDASCILYHKEGSTAVHGILFWWYRKLPALSGAWSRKELYKRSKLLSKYCHLGHMIQQTLYSMWSVRDGYRCNMELTVNPSERITKQDSEILEQSDANSNRIIYILRSNSWHVNGLSFRWNTRLWAPSASTLRTFHHALGSVTPAKSLSQVQPAVVHCKMEMVTKRGLLVG